MQCARDRFRLENAIRAIGPVRVVDLNLRALVRGYAPPNLLNAILHETVEYFASPSIAEASEILASYAGNVRVVAGGTDLLLELKAGHLAPKAVVNIKRIPDLRGLKNGTHARAATRVRERCGP